MLTRATPGGEVAVRIDAVRTEQKSLPRASAVPRSVLICLALIGCDQAATGPELPEAAMAPVAADIVLSATSVTLEVGETVALAAVVLDQYGDEMFDVVVEWTSADPSVATVGSDGTLVAAAPGSIDVTASYDRLTGTISTWVEPATPVPTEIVVSQTSVTLDEGETVVLTAVVLDQFGNEMPDVEVEWTTSDPSVVSVESGAAPTPGLSLVGVPDRLTQTRDTRTHTGIPAEE